VWSRKCSEIYLKIKGSPLNTDSLCNCATTFLYDFSFLCSEVHATLNCKVKFFHRLFFAQIPDGTEEVTLLCKAKDFRGGDYRDLLSFRTPFITDCRISPTDEAKEQEKSSAIISHFQF